MCEKSRKAALAALMLLLVGLLFPVRAVPAAERQDRSYSRNFYRELARKLSRNREDYPHLTDEAFANFRAVMTTGMGTGKLYRSSSPVNPWGHRNVIADDAARAVGVRTFVNLADTEKKLRAYPGFQDSYYSTQNVIRLHLNWKYASPEFRRNLARGLSLMARGEPPFLIHCDMGKDRAGFVCALLECLMGASAEEVTADYLLSFSNYFGISPGTKDYHFIADGEIRRFLAAAFGVRDIAEVNLPAAAERYLLGLGVPARDIAALRRKLGP